MAAGGEPGLVDGAGQAEVLGVVQDRKFTSRPDTAARAIDQRRVVQVFTPRKVSPTRREWAESHPRLTSKAYMTWSVAEV